MQSINYTAPVQCRQSIIINANSVAVWKTLTDINKWQTWQKEIKTAKLNGPLQPDTTIDWKTGGIKIHSTIHTSEPYAHFGWSGKTIGLFAIHNWKITELNKQTEVVVEESMEGILATLFKKTFNKRLDKSVRTWLEFLKKECEEAVAN